ncbi:MAG TPA: hypothetical protein ENF17_08195 [Candidatus Aminicenantes bacterium]|nr:hypothetical protein [Candidatus Aminicenantes bacterium]
MKYFKSKKFLVIPLLFSLLFLLVTFPVEGKGLTHQDCLDAFKRCGVDAVISLVSGSYVASLIYFGSCLVGYDFCVRYVIIN